MRATLLRGGRTVQRGERGLEVLDTKPKAATKPEVIDLVLTDHADLGTGPRPISTAVPLPRGLLTDADLDQLTVERRTLTHDDPDQPYAFRWEPMDTGFSVRNRWYRDGSIRWLGVDFQADYYRGRQRAVLDPTHPLYPTYRLNLRRATVAPARQVRVEEDDGQIVITTGPMKAVISKTDFRLVNEAWLDADHDGTFTPAERMIVAGAGDGLHCAVDEGGDLTAGGEGTRVWVQEANSMRAIVVAEGEYRGAGKTAGRHLTRLFFVRDQATVDVHHTYIITGDTHRETLSNAAIRLGVPGVSRFLFASEGGDRIEGDHRCQIRCRSISRARCSASGPRG